jgi:DNA-binding CsgD family transcriptional regulator
MAKILGVTSRRDLFAKAYDLDRIFEKLEKVDLTHREKEVMKLALSGMMVSDICKVFKRSVSTIKDTIHSARKKIGARRIVEVYYKLDPDAIRQDFIEKVLSAYPLKSDKDGNDSPPPIKVEEKDENIVLPIGSNKFEDYGLP